MSEQINKIKAWYGEISEKKISFEKKGIKPRRDWSIILFAVFCLVLVLAGFSYYFYVAIDNGTFFTISEEDTLNEVKINNNLLLKISGDIKDREENLLEIKSGKAVPANPAL